MVIDAIVSIHAPREGYDSHLTESLVKKKFQFTHPGRGATQLVLLERCLLSFQFTHPGRGATHVVLKLMLYREGFNSRTPGGVRLCFPVILSQASCFNSRTPGGVRQILKDALFIHVKFQFTHPGRGATLGVWGAFSRKRFQFTHPGRGATWMDMSILGTPPCFNSRTPGGVRQNTRHSTETYLKFQFTHPGRGATATRCRRKGIGQSFNSRTPGGVRRCPHFAGRIP